MAKIEEKRRLFDELADAVDDIAKWREGKVTLKTYKAKPREGFVMTPEIIRETREKLNLSRPVFAHQLHVSPRTLEKWEQGRSKPNEQAVALLMLVRKFPDTLQRLKELAAL